MPDVVDVARSRRPLAAPPGDTRLTRAGLAAIDSVAPDLADSAVVLVLADAAGCLQHRTPTNHGFARILDRAGLVVGHDLSVQAAGTNAVGTALTSGALVTVVGDEHDRHDFRLLAGVAMPVQDPVAGHVLGAVGLLTRARSIRPFHIALVRQTGLLAEQLMLGLDAEEHQRLLARYLAASRAPDAAVLAVSEQSLYAGPGVMRLLDGLTHEDLWAPTYDALTLRPTQDLPLALPNGGRLLVRLEPVELDGRLVGAIGEVLSEDDERPGPTGGSLAVPEYRNWSPAARRTATALRRAAEERRAVCVVGEDGVGKATTVRVVAARAFLGRNVVEIAPGQATPARVEAELGNGSPVLVTDADTLTTEQLLALADTARAARTSRHGGWLALTYQGQPDALDERLYASRLAIIPASPLRARPQDVEQVLPAMLRRYAGGRDLGMTPALVDRLRREPWPRNFHGLEAVVAEIAQGATRRVLDVGDLPEDYRAILRRRLTPMEWMTRSAIVAALQASGGNKKLAAEALGMSRASIYRKIKAFDIDVDDVPGDEATPRRGRPMSRPADEGAEG